MWVTFSTLPVRYIQWVCNNGRILGGPGWKLRSMVVFVFFKGKTRVMLGENLTKGLYIGQYVWNILEATARLLSQVHVRLPFSLFIRLVHD